jgi:hypothetical protein
MSLALLAWSSFKDPGLKILSSSNVTSDYSASSPFHTEATPQNIPNFTHLDPSLKPWKSKHYNILGWTTHGAVNEAFRSTLTALGVNFTWYDFAIPGSQEATGYFDWYNYSTPFTSNSSCIEILGKCMVDSWACAFFLLFVHTA